LPSVKIKEAAMEAKRVVTCALSSVLFTLLVTNLAFNIKHATAGEKLAKSVKSISRIMKSQAEWQIALARGRCGTTTAFASNSAQFDSRLPQQSAARADFAFEQPDLMSEANLQGGGGEAPRGIAIGGEASQA
jgi:hypothetical protein